jgi:uroporphyrin-3 C-methyltransferase
MTDPNTPSQTGTATEPPVAAPPAPPLKRALDFLLHLSIPQMTLALVLAVFLWQWFDMHRQLGGVRQELARKITEMDGRNQASQALVKQTQDAVRDVSAKVAVLEAKYAETETQRASLESLYQSLSSSRDEMALAEVEQTLMIAQQQLQLSANVKAALIALQQADSRLQRMNRPALNGVRKAIAQDMDKLRALPAVDIPGMTFKLDGLIASVETLPLVQEVRPKAAPAAGQAAVAPEAGWQKLVRDIWEEAKHLVRIQNMQKRELPLLSPTETFFLRENLKLRLLSVRLALLARDEGNFKRDLAAAQDWVNRYFDTAAPDGQLALATLKKLGSGSISIELPDVSPTVEAVRNYRTSREKGAR